MIETAQDIVDPHSVGFTHGFQNQSFHDDLPVKSISQDTPCRCQLFKKDAHHIAVGRQSPQLPVGGDGFRCLIKNRFRLRKQCTEFHCPERSQHLFKQSLKILAPFGKFGNDGNDSGRIVAEHGTDERIQIPPVGQTEKRKDLFPGDSAAIPSEKEGDHLIQKGLSVTHSPFCGAGNG